MANICMYTPITGERYICFNKDADTLWFSTRPLDDAPWQAVPFLRLLVFREGRLVFQGEGGSQEYFDPEKDFEYKRLDFANL